MSTAILDNPTAPHEEPAKVRRRLELFDAARLAASIGIVWLHTPRSVQLAHWSLLGRFAVPFFSAAAVFFVIDGLRRQPHRSVRQYAFNRFQRIYVPFLVWSMIYLVFKWVKSLALPDQPNDFPGVEAFWTGTFFHLWFMPFVLLLTLGVFAFGRTIVGHQERESAVCILSVVIGAALAIVPPPKWIAADTSFLLLAWQTLPAACWGLSLAMIYPHGFERFASRPRVTVIAIAAFLGLIGLLATVGRNTLIENLCGITFFVAALQPCSTKWIAPLAQFGSLAYGIYLCHLLVIKTFEGLAAKAHFPITWSLDVAIFFLAAIGSTLLAWSLSRSTRTRWLAA